MPTADIPPEKIYLGCVDALGKVHGYRVNVTRYRQTHDESPTHSGLNLPHGSRWRYPEGSNTVFWWEAPNQEEEHAVENFQARRIPQGDLRHRRLVDYESNSPECDASHGEGPLLMEYRRPGPYWLSPGGTTKPAPTQCL